MSQTTVGAGSGRSGLYEGARNGASALLKTGRTRLELLGNELKEEKLRAVRLLLWSQILVFCLALGTTLLLVLLLVVYWDNRVVVLSCASAFFIAGSGVAYAALQRAMRRPERLFATSLAELDEDLRQLQRSTGNESSAD